jgi:Flp pilus assembly pilin Flp
MKLFSLVKSFVADEAGAVTVDWVVLTAAIVGLGIAVIVAVSSGVNTLGTAISSTVATQTVGVP